MTFLELAVITSLSCVSMYVLFQSNMLLSFFTDRYRIKDFTRNVVNEYDDNKTKWYHKPLFACVGCMASFWGASFYALYTVALEFRCFDSIEMLCTCLICVPLNFIFNNLT